MIFLGHFYFLVLSSLEINILSYKYGGTINVSLSITMLRLGVCIEFKRLVPRFYHRINTNLKKTNSAKVYQSKR